MRIIEPKAYTGLQKAIKEFVDRANFLDEEVIGLFNGQELLVKPGDIVSSILHTYFMQGYPIYAELVNRNYISAEMSLSREGQTKWVHFIRGASHSAGLELIMYAQRWACLMEAWLKLYPKDHFWEFADQCAFLADTSGNNILLMARAVPILKKFWIYGEELAEWYYEYVLKILPC